MSRAHGLPSSSSSSSRSSHKTPREEGGEFTPPSSSLSPQARPRRGKRAFSGDNGPSPAGAEPKSKREEATKSARPTEALDRWVGGVLDQWSREHDPNEEDAEPASSSSATSVGKPAANASKPGAPDGGLLDVCCIAECHNKAGTLNMCCKHGGQRRCAAPGCSKAAQQGGRCKAHGGGRSCEIPGCNTTPANRSLICKRHGGGQRCMVWDCPTAAVNGYLHCKKHGGGRRCRALGCRTAAFDPYDKCRKHGGGEPCSVEECTKLAIWGYKSCGKHGGGKRCALDGCTKPAKAKGICLRHQK